MFSSDRRSHRQVFIDAWQKAHRGQPVAPLEAQIIEILRQHPEYHRFLIAADAALEQDFPPELGETNPFLHMGLHLAIREQVSIDQPVGIRAQYQKLVRHLRNPHETEHRVMDCLAEGIWTLQHDHLPFNAAAYLACIKRMARR